MGDVGFAGTAFSSLGNQSDKPRVRAEPDEPQAPLAFFVYAEKFSHGLPALNHHVYIPPREHHLHGVLAPRSRGFSATLYGAEHHPL